eukprot:13219298-Alexandrium_andersonii.AAC.1
MLASGCRAGPDGFAHPLFVEWGWDVATQAHMLHRAAALVRAAAETQERRDADRRLRAFRA